MKNANFPILIVVLVLIAVLAQFTRHPQENAQVAARQDMEKCLALLWGQDGQQVELTPAGERVDVRAAVFMPAGGSPRRERWNRPFLSFVALRHSGLVVRNLEVVDGRSQRPVSSLTDRGLLAERISAGGSTVYDEDKLCELTQRQLSSALSQSLGPLQSLVLVDAQASSARRDGEHYGSPPSDGLAMRALRVAPYSFSLDICVVVNRQIPADVWKDFRDRHVGKVQKIRVLVLPQP